MKHVDLSQPVKLFATKVVTECKDEMVHRILNGIAAASNAVAGATRADRFMALAILIGQDLAERREYPRGAFSASGGD
jgi:hypothetical protein